ncbi:efflux RND transporter periplasmic adaptor subunit [Lujinxingia vulgaris]|uniref:Efflux RND transporter periplasmic adaptor subunit n=1 Tax=Lujinxingia vulgaris TaxID=2600176 RepID=A0A5C6XKJ5_9DELT|nr:efflux RND transporter periplasmic adaptor subunit [Lujinxingia vulgaris]TXD41611.1 efflux RND transporter periplasmic adaptor subunit [Lujinxingia vulgaris]
MRTLIFLFMLTTLLIAGGCESSESSTSSESGENAHDSHDHSKAASQPITAHADDWCGGHDIPESMCTKCNPELIDKFKAQGDWCEAHGFPESACPQCNPVSPPGEQASANTITAHANDWCGGHDIPESMCTKCNPELIDKFKAQGDWCEAHGFPESACPQCNPVTPPSRSTSTSAGHDHDHDHGGQTQSSGAHLATAQPGDWCAGHNIPESKCTKCNPELAEGFQAEGDWCAEHGFPESACPYCNPVAPPTAGVVLHTADHEDLAGLMTAPARADQRSEGLSAPARFSFNADRVAEVRTLQPGIVREILVQPGERVEAGQALIKVESAQASDQQAELLAARQALRTAESHLERQQTLREQGINGQRDVELAMTEAERARARVRTAEAALRLSGSVDARGQLTLRAPIAGEVVERNVIAGSYTSAEMALMTIADRSAMWAEVFVPASQSRALALGQRVRLSPEQAPEVEVTGQVAQIATRVDPATGNLRVRLELDPADLPLRDGQLAHATIETGQPTRAMRIPREAVQRFNDQRIVFVRERQGVYQTRKVEIVASERDTLWVAGELSPDEPVITTGAFVLLTELRADDIGVGCTH